MRHLIMLFLSALLFLLGGGDCNALMMGLSTDELTRQSDLVVEGDVVQVVSYWSADGKRIFSSATISVVDVVKGSGRKTVVAEYEGGEIGGIGMRVSDMEPLLEGSRVLLFLKARPETPGGKHGLVGLSQGVYAIGKDRVARKGGFSLAGEAAAVDNDIPVDLLKEKIRRAR